MLREDENEISRRRSSAKANGIVLLQSEQNCLCSVWDLRRQVRFVFDSSKSQVNSGVNDMRFFGNLVLEVLLGGSGHDQQAAMG